MTSISKKHIVYFLILILFLTGLFFRVSLDGLPENHPGNLKAANAFYHTIAADHIAETGKIFNHPWWDAEGHDDIISTVSQHEAVLIAPLIKLTGIPDWNAAYLIVCILSALAIPLMYMLTRKLFNSHLIGIIAAGVLVLPLDLSNWLYYQYIGIWLQSSVTPFMLLSFILIIDILKKPETWKILALGINIAAVFLMFPPVLIFLFPLLLIVLWKLAFKEKKKAKRLAAYIIIPLIAIIIFMPSLLVGDIGARINNEESPFYFATPNYDSTPFAKGFEGTPIILLILFGLGIIQLLLNYKKYRPLIAYSIYFVAVVYLFPFFIHNMEYYLMRMKGFLIYLMAPIIAYGIYYFIIKNIAKYFNKKTLITIVILILLVLGGISQFNTLKSQLNYEHIPADKYVVAKWIQENIPEDEHLFMLEGDYQLEATYFQRVRFTLYQEEFANYIKQLQETGDPTEVTGHWSGYIDWSKWKTRTGYLSFEEYEPLSKTQKITDFNYIYLESLNQQLLELNQYIASWLVQENNYEPIYEQGRFLILKKNE
ncbi:MAG: hypothetical protein ABIH25_01625 [Candidatus Woesearchaeota archaeon]